MSIHFKKTSQFEFTRSKIEQHLYDSVYQVSQSEELALRSIENFSQSVDSLLNTLEVIYKNPKAIDIIGEKSFPIYRGRYRVFYRILIKENDFQIVLLDLDDNRQSNLDRFPEHLTTFDDD